MTHETQQATHAEPSAYVFSTRELARLATYRAAVIAGFYNEKLDSAEFQSAQALRAGNRRDKYSSH